MKTLSRILLLSLLALLLAACASSQWTGSTYLGPKWRVNQLAPGDAAAQLMTESAMGWHGDRATARAQLVNFLRRHRVTDADQRAILADVDAEARQNRSTP